MEPAQRAETTAEIKAMVRATVFLVRMRLRRFDEVLEMEEDRAAEDVDIESSKGRPVRWRAVVRCGDGWDMMAVFDPRRTAKDREENPGNGLDYRRESILKVPILIWERGIA